MSYFILSQDDRIPDAIEPVGIRKAIPKDILDEARIGELKEMSLQFPVPDREQIEYVDFIERPIPLLSDKLKQLIEKFLPRQFYHPVGLVDFTRMRQEVYWIALPQRMDCLSDLSEYHPNGTLKRPVIRVDMARNAPFFQIDGIYETILVVNLFLAESLLRRDFHGLRLTKVDKV
ncbi:serine protease [Paenibacillus thiaminolyticus]|uniref:serine protease n=1 Tax=Paenibacillus thiaminolyticus TaxID=49283 RepID=UPI0035A6ED7F